MSASSPAGEEAEVINPVQEFFRQYKCEMFSDGWLIPLPEPHQRPVSNSQPVERRAMLRDAALVHVATAEQFQQTGASGTVAVQGAIFRFLVTPQRQQRHDAGMKAGAWTEPSLAQRQPRRQDAIHDLPTQFTFAGQREQLGRFAKVVNDGVRHVLLGQGSPRCHELLDAVMHDGRHCLQRPSVYGESADGWRIPQAGRKLRGPALVRRVEAGGEGIDGGWVVRVPQGLADFTRG